MEQSILKSTKQVLQIGPDDESFDLAIMTHINSAFSTLNDLGVGPEEGFTIEDDTPVWMDFYTDSATQLNQIKVFVFLHSRMLFDPPTTTFHLSAMEKQLEQLTWRINVKREESDWIDPNPPADLVVVDGGDPTGT